MAAKIIHPSLPKNKLSHTLYVRAWRKLTGKKYTQKRVGKMKKIETESALRSPGRPRAEDEIVIDRTSPTIAALEQRLKQIDNNFRQQIYV